LTLAFGLTACGVLNAGWSKFKVEKDPVRLWVAHDSELAQQQRTFEKEFGPFYRTEQIFLSSRLDKEAPFFSWSTVQWWSGIESDIRHLVSPAGTMLKDVCFAPSAPSQESVAVDDCTVQSFMGYYADSLDKITVETWATELDFCATTPSACLSSSGQPLNPRVLFGGIPGYSGNRNYTAARIPASQARAAVVTYVVNNSLDPATIKKVEEWERALKVYMQTLSNEARDIHGVDLNFSTGVSLEEELNKSTNTDVPIVVLSYLLMFLYVSISLGGTGAGLLKVLWALLVSAGSALTGRRASTGPIALGNTQNRNSSSASVSSARLTVGTAVRDLFVDSKFSLGLFGIAIVLLSVSTSVGVFSFFGVRVTLIIAEVIPFLVLAIGVDNVFILAHELDRQNARAYSSMPRHVSADDYFDASELPPAEERVAKALSRMGPSIMLSSSCQAVAFALGTTVGMPAVRNFAIYAAGAVVINALLQVTVFISAMTLDLKRLEVRFAFNLEVPSAENPISHRGWTAYRASDLAATTINSRPLQRALSSGSFVRYTHPLSLGSKSNMLFSHCSLVSLLLHGYAQITSN
jgi:Niemann-Pick C1 protein